MSILVRMTVIEFDTSKFIGTLSEPCPCDCGHKESATCDNGCHPLDFAGSPTWSGWTCFGGVMYRLYDRRTA